VHDRCLAEPRERFELEALQRDLLAIAQDRAEGAARLAV